MSQVLVWRNWPTAICLVLLNAVPAALYAEEIDWATKHTKQREAVEPPSAKKYTKQALWRVIERSAREAKVGKISDPAGWWMDQFSEAGALVMGICCTEGAQPIADLFVEEFGKHNVVTDTLLLHSYGHLTVQHWGLVPGDPDRDRDMSRHAPTRRAIYGWLEVVSEAQVKLFLEQPEMFDRWYRAVMWSEYPFGVTRPSSEFIDSHKDLVEMFEYVVRFFPQNKTPEDDHYWYYARMFIFLAKATSTDDALKGAAPNALFKVFERWHVRMVPHIRYALPHPKEPRWFIDREQALKKTWKSQDYRLPEGPFPDWDFPIPPANLDTLDLISIAIEVPQGCRDRGLWPGSDPDREHSAGPSWYGPPLEDPD